MTYEYKCALERIIALCEKSRQPTRRTERIHDIALEALGLIANQRDFEIRKVREKANEYRRARILKFNQKGPLDRS